MKKKLTIEQKVILSYSIELIVIALIALVIGVLKLVDVIHTKPNRLLVYNVISLIGGLWIIIELIWAFCSPKKKQRTCLLDKYLLLPAMGYLLAFDVYCFIYYGQEINDLFVRISIGAVLIYIALAYIYQGIYHYKHPVPQILAAIEEMKKAEEAEKKEEEESKVVDAESEDIKEEK